MEFILILAGIGIIVFFAWVFKHSWNERGIIDELEEANRLKKLELELKIQELEQKSKQ